MLFSASFATMPKRDARDQLDNSPTDSPGEIHLGQNVSDEDTQ